MGNTRKPPWTGLNTKYASFDPMGFAPNPFIPDSRYSDTIAMAKNSTTIQVSPKLLSFLRKRKTGPKESYEDVIWDIIEDSLELSDETKEAIRRSEEDARAGRVVTLEQLKKDLGLEK